MGLEEIRQGIVYLLKVNTDTLLVEKGKKFPKGMYTLIEKGNSVEYGTMYILANVKGDRTIGKRRYSVEGDKLQSLIERGVFERC